MRFTALAKAAVSLLRPEDGILAAGPTTDLKIPCTVDGQTHDLLFRCHARDMAKIRVIAPSTLECAVPNRHSILLVHTGDCAGPACGSGISPLTLKAGSALVLNLGVQTQAGAVKSSISLNQYDRKRRRIAQPVAAMEGDQISGLLALRPDAETYGLALRFSGAGTVRFGQMTIEYLDPWPDIVSAPGDKGAVGDLLTKQVQVLHRQRKYAEAMSFIERFPEAWAHREVLRLLTLYLEGDYEAVVRSFESGTGAVRANRAARHRHFRSLANLGRIADLRQQIQQYLDAGEARAFLATALPFAHGLDSEICRRLATYLMADPALPLSAVIGCAEIFLEIGEADLANDAVKRAWRTARSRYEKAETLLLRANIALRQHASGDAAKHLSAAFRSIGLDPVELHDPGERLSPQNLRARKPAAARGRLPKTSVIVPCYNSQATLPRALASLCAQSHGDLEILVVDDGSTDNSLAAAHAAAAQDGRIRILPQKTNCGAYTARNIGLQSASGQLVVVHDADDWAHPRKVEKLAHYLSANPRKVGVRAKMIRFSPEIGSFHHNTYIRDDVSSFMFRREEALASIGFFDSVRAGADSEYIFRLERLLGMGCTAQIDDPLTVKLWSTGSLSGGGIFQIDEFSGAFSSARAAYRNAYIRWHEAGKGLRLEFPLRGRPFDVPFQLLP